MDTGTVILGLILAALIGALVYWGNRNQATVKKLEDEAKAKAAKLEGAAKAEVADVEKKL